MWRSEFLGTARTFISTVRMTVVKSSLLKKKMQNDENVSTPPGRKGGEREEEKDDEPKQNNRNRIIVFSFYVPIDSEMPSAIRDTESTAKS